MKEPRKWATLISCLLWLSCLGKWQPAAADSQTAIAKASASVNFVVRIPRVLSFRLEEPDAVAGSEQPTDRTLNAPDRDAAAVRIYDLYLRGNLSPGGCMALTIESAAGALRHGSTAESPTSLMWTAKGVDVQDDLYRQAAQASAPHSFVFHKRHRVHPGKQSEPLVYTLCAP